MTMAVMPGQIVAETPRLCLHAETLAFDWPAAGGPQHYYSPAPF